MHDETVGDSRVIFCGFVCLDPTLERSSLYVIANHFKKAHFNQKETEAIVTESTLVLKNTKDFEKKSFNTLTRYKILKMDNARFLSKI